MTRTLNRILLACCLLGFVPAARAEDPKDKVDVTVEKLVGTWKLVKSDQRLPDDVTFSVEFTREGVITIRVEPKNLEPIVMKGKYTLKDGKIDYSVTLPDGEKKQEVLTVKKFGGEELVTEDPNKIKETFARVKPKQD